MEQRRQSRPDFSQGQILALSQSRPDSGLGLSHVQQESLGNHPRCWPAPFSARKALKSFEVFPPRSAAVAAVAPHENIEHQVVQKEKVDGFVPALGRYKRTTFANRQHLADLRAARDLACLLLVAAIVPHLHELNLIGRCASLFV